MARGFRATASPRGFLAAGARARLSCARKNVFVAKFNFFPSSSDQKAKCGEPNEPQREQVSHSELAELRGVEGWNYCGRVVASYCELTSLLAIARNCELTAISRASYCESLRVIASERVIASYRERVIAGYRERVIASELLRVNVRVIAG